MSWFKNKIGNKMSDDIEDTTNVLKFPEPKHELKLVEPLNSESSLDCSESPYTIGVNISGNTQFMIANQYGKSILTMSSTSVVSLIENLAHTIRKTHTVQITEK